MKESVDLVKITLGVIKPKSTLYIYNKLYCNRVITLGGARGILGSEPLANVKMKIQKI